jgi:putative flippase GtrA
MYVLITNFSISPMLAKTIGIFVEFIFNFLVRQFFIFSPEKIN